MISIAVDGFAGSGKSSLVKLLAEKLGQDFKVLDTGAIFRGFAYAYKELKLGEMTENSVKEFLKKVSLSVSFVGSEQHVFANGKDVTPYIRTAEMGELSSKISCFEEVRMKYLVIAQNFAVGNNVIMEGRDIGTVVMPNATVKIFLTADEKTRARRRYDELKLKDKKITLKQVLEDLEKRDKRDQNKGIYSLRITKDSIVVDNTNMNLEQTVDYCYDLVQNVIGPKDVTNITIDGYVCSGKSTIAKAIAKKLGYSVFDTGALYRGVACAFDYMHLDEKKINEKYIDKFAEQIHLSVEFIDGVEHVYVNGIDYTSGLRTEHISELSAKISPFMSIRNKVLKLQRDYAKNHDIVMEGRDIGSYVLPNAQYKFFCTADEKVRAKRRYEQQKAMGNDVKFAEVLKELRERDYADVHRDHGALMTTPTSIIIDTTNQSLEESVAFCLSKMK